MASSILVTVAIIGVAHYLSASYDRAAEERTPTLEPPDRSQPPIADLRVSAETSAAQSHQIFELYG